MWINDYTGEIYSTIWEAVKTIISDFLYFPKCRTWKMFSISRYH